MKDWIKELCPEIADWQAELIVEHCQPKREWQKLSWEEIDECFKITPDQYLPAQIYKRIEAKLKEKNDVS